MIDVVSLSKKYGTHLAVDNVSFSIDKGEIVGFLGPNGAGKSTIMNIITGYLSYTVGNVSIDGIDIIENPEAAKKRIGYLPEIPPLYVDMTVQEYLYFVYDLKKVKFPKAPHIEEIMRLVQIGDVKKRLIKNLSKGYRQRVGFASALVGNPDVLILDEPTVGLDPKQIIEIRNLITKLGKNHTIILSSHILSEIQAVCKRVIIINKGQIIADDTPENLSAKLSEDNSLVARIVCNEADMIKTLSTVPGVMSVTSLGKKEDGAFEFSIIPEDRADVRAAVFNKVKESGKTMLSFRSNGASLEQIFLRLTEAGDNDEARKMLGLAPEEIKEETPETEETKETEETNETESEVKSDESSI
ncbi:MAG: ATP-binding cassette domain-containing protein [Clostridia bacterium]|nr:ATP-binding cassette domain-containing protein [Clostridia bacterium]